jgi:hypothetical protein
MRRMFLACLVATGAGILALSTLVAARPQQSRQHVFLPLAARAVVLAELPQPPSLVATATTAPPTATATATRMPTFAPSVEPPTETPTTTTEPSPTAEPGGRIVGRLLVNGEPAGEGTGLISARLYLRHCQVASCTILARSGVLDKDSGNYAFENVAPLSGGYYQVTWWNEESSEDWADPEKIGSWYGPRIAVFDGHGEVAGGDFELADIILTQPTHGTGFQGLPIHFEWEVRPLAETYRWVFGRCGSLATRANPMMRTESLGRGGKYDLTSYPPGIRFGNDNEYCWWIQADGSNGYGESFYPRTMWFIPVLRQLLPARPAGLSPVRKGGER